MIGRVVFINNLISVPVTLFISIFFTGEAYRDGHEFCLGQKFSIVDTNAGCFQFDRTVFSRASRTWSLLIVCSIILLGM